MNAGDGKRSTLAAALLLGACSVPETPSILLLTLDTTRADALSTYGGEGAHTPNLDGLAAEGIVYENAFTSAPLTLPAHASIMTGLYPLRHGVRDNGMSALPAEATTLAERAREAGCRTAAFVSSVVLDSSFGLDQGFQTYASPSKSHSRAKEHADHGEYPARQVVDMGLAWLGASSGKPFFLWLHFYDPHSPYEAPERGDCATVGDGESSSRARYLREVCVLDAEIGRLLTEMRSKGQLDGTHVLVVGDHGEAFGEHGEFGHTAHCFDTTLRVPMILRLADGAHAGERRTDVVSVVDALPTLAGLAHWGPSYDTDGRDLLAGPTPEDRGVYFESYYGFISFGWSPIAGWLDANGKYLHTSAPEFYDLARDRAEAADLIATGDAPDLSRYKTAIAQLADKPRLVDMGGAADAEALESLRGLGYVALGDVDAELLPHPLATHVKPSPSAMAGHYERSIDALEHFQAGRPGEAVPILEEVRAVNPENPFLLDMLAKSLVQLGEHGRAVPVIEDLLKYSLAELPAAWGLLGECKLALGRLDEAREAFEKAHRLAPEDPRFERALEAVDAASAGD